MATGMLPGGPADDSIDTAGEHRALACTAAAAVAAIFWLVRPVALGILLGTTACATANLYRRIADVLIEQWSHRAANCHGGRPIRRTRYESHRPRGARNAAGREVLPVAGIDVRVLSRNEDAYGSANPMLWREP